MMLHHLLAVFVVNTAPGGFGVVFPGEFWELLGFILIMQTTTCKTQ